MYPCDLGGLIAALNGGGLNMKKLIVGFLCAGGFLMAQNVTYTYQPVEPGQQQGHLSQDARIALRSQSPSVKTHSRKHADRPSKYVVTENKTTIVATRAYGK
jgi:hypothetical protein